MKSKTNYALILLIVFSAIFLPKLQAQTISVGTIVGSPFCQGAVFNVPYTVTGVFNPSNTFYIEMSDQFGNFPTPFPFVGSINATTNNSVFCTIPASAPAGNLYVLKVVSNSPIITSGNVSNAITVQIPSGDPSDFGTNAWTAYGFTDNNFVNYAGSFNIATLNFDTPTFYGVSASPSSATGYSGCPIPVDNHSVRFKRRGFPCDFYQIDLPTFDQNIEILVNGISIYINNTPASNISNVARVFLGANSTIEVRLKEFTGTTNLGLRFTPVTAIETSPIVYKCSGASVTLMATSGQAGLSYSWTQAGIPISALPNVTVNPAVNTAYVVTVTDPLNPGICPKSMNVDVVVSGGAVTTVTPTAFARCTTNVKGIPLTASGAYTYTWSPATGLSATTGNTVIANPVASTTYTVIGNDGCGVTSSATVVFTVGNGGGNPAVFGANQWTAYAYNATNFTNYAGYYTEPALSFNSAPRWVGGSGGTPSSASGYVGCNVATGNNSVIYKRQGFPCGRYRLDIPNHRNNVTVFVNGTQVFQFIGCCIAHNNIWTGFLDATSTIEYRWQGTAAGSFGTLNFTLLTNTLFNASPVSVCPNINQTITANLLVGATYVWDNTTLGFVSGVNNLLTVNQPNGATQTYNVVATLNSCVYSASITVNFTATIPAVSITAPITNICGNVPVTLMGNGATTYTWSPATGLSATTGGSVIANPPMTTTYTVTGFNDCLLSNTATVTVIVPISPSIFGANTWNAYVYAGAGFNSNSSTSVTPPLGTYQGFYTQSGLNFYSANVWVAGQNGTPSSVTGYVGCPVGVDNHSVVYRRQGFPCGYYSLDVVHSNTVLVFVNGVQVFTNVSCCVLRPNVWTGYLDASSTVELRWTAGAGASYSGITFNENSQATLFSAIPNSVTICEGLTPTSSAATLTANTVVGVTYNWAVTTGTLTLSATTGTSIQVYAPPGSTGTGSVTCTATIAGCSFPKVINFNIDPNPSTAVVADKMSICLGETVKLDATGANTYVWTLTTGNTATAGLSTTTGFTVNSIPTLAGTYTYSVAGSNNCNTISAMVTVTVLGPTLLAGTPGTTATGGWNVFCYAGNGNNLVGSVYKGHYTEPNISFNSLTRWTTLSSPYPPAGVPISTYVGCEIPVDYHTLRYIRTGFPCGNYKIDVPYHDDTYQLFINGTQVSTFVVCCQSHANVWNGLLTPASVVEFRWYEGINGSSGALNIGFSFTGVTTTTWTGAVNTNWFDPANWCVTVPNSTTDVIIPPNAPNMPIINAAGAQALSININNSGALFGSLTILGTNAMEVFGNFTNNGIFVANSSTVNFVGTAPATIGGTTVTNFNNLNLNSTQTVSLVNPIQVSGILSLNNTQLSLNSNTLTINNPSLTAITSGASGFIRSETNAGTNPSILCWNAGATIGNFKFPFGTSATSFVPAFFNKKTATNYSICMSTRATSTNNLPIATGANLLNIYGFLNGENVVDRWWDIATSIDPLPLADAADITLTYRGLENTTPAGNTGILAIQHFDPATGFWDIPYPSSTVGVTSGTSTITATNIRKFSPHVIVPILTPLPIELLYFSARKSNAQVDINWETITETNNDFFNVERSTDNVRFESIGMVLAKKTIGNKTYNFVDKNPIAGTSYYRLKQTDNDRKVGYSRSASVNFGEKNIATLEIFPNPTTQDNVGIALYGEKEESYQVSISNMEGKVIFSENIKTDVSGKYKATLAMRNNLAQGVYVMKVISENNVFVKKIIIQ